MFDKLIVTVLSAPNYCYRCALCLYGILHATKQNNLPPSHVHSQSGAEMSLRFWNWTRIYVRNTESSLMRLPYVCLTPSSSVMLIIFVGCPFHTGEAAATRLLPLTLFVYSLSMYELHFFGIHHFQFSSQAIRHVSVILLVISQLSVRLSISFTAPLRLNNGFHSNDSLHSTVFCF